MSVLSWQFTPYTVPILLAGSIVFTCGVLLWRGGAVRNRFAGLLLLELSLWMFGYTMELTAIELAPKILAQNIQFGAWAFVSVTLLAFVTTYSGYGRWMRTEILVPSSIPSLATVALLATNRYHQLIAHDYMLDTSGPFVVLARSWGPWYYFTIAYTYLLLLIGTGLLFRIFLRSTARERGQTGLLIIGIIFPCIGSFLDILGVNTKFLYGFNFTPFGFLITGLIITWNLFYYQFGNIIPVSYETAMDNMSDGVLVADPAGQIVASNTAAKEIFQHIGKSLKGHCLRELIPNLPEIAGSSPEDSGAAEGETVLRIPESCQTYSLRRSWVMKQKQPISQILVLRDMSERFRAEQDLLEAKALAEEANHAKSEFLANMSHELRTPLHHIIGFTELIANRQFGDLTETQAEYLQDVLDSGRNLLELINDIVEITKIDTGMLEVQQQTTYLPEILEGTLTLLREKALKHGITINLETGSLPEAVLLDIRKIKQSLFNVVSKAVALTPDGGQVDLDVRIDPRGRSQPVLLVVRVNCFDVAISRQDLESIFKPFEQVKSSTDHPYLARGSGLALAKRLVELQGGRIWAESADNQRGITFVLELPVSTANGGAS
jgi:signal transduction histidine kinase